MKEVRQRGWVSERHRPLASTADYMVVEIQYNPIFGSNKKTDK
jgi:hypothetical protein